MIDRDRGINLTGRAPGEAKDIIVPGQTWYRICSNEYRCANAGIS